MAAIFETGPGQAVALAAENGDLALPLAIDGASGSWFPSFRSVLTGVEIALDGNVQFTHTLRDVIYVYAFGDRISHMQLTGVSFARGCAGGRSGIEEVLDLYALNRVAVRAAPVQVQIGVSAAGRFRGCVTGFRASIIKPEARLSQFALSLSIFPGN
jgi:hypothetical protein